jgi:CheY-like chemotaxis protein
LDLSKIEAGRLEIHPEPTSIKSVVDDVQSLLGPQAVEKGLTLETEFEGRLPVRIETDPLRVRQILLNLVGNAVKFTERGSVRVSVQCRADTNPAELVLTVRDTGIGIPPDQFGAIFEAFSQQNPEISRRYGGTGLGLTICQRLVRMLSGQITLDSQVGAGSEFVVQLPIGDPSQLELVEADAIPDPTRVERTGEPLHIPCRVLVVEDNRGLQFMLRRMIEGAVDSVHIVGNGQEAIEEMDRSTAAGTPYHLVLMDMHMPVLNGFDATVRLRSAGYKLPIIALTAGAMSGDRAQCLAAGCDDYLSKPVDRERMLSLINDYYQRTVASRMTT